jgi:hypothetical protein
LAIRANYLMCTKNFYNEPINMFFGDRELVHTDEVMKFVGLKRSSFKYKLKLNKRYERPDEHDNMLSKQLMMQQVL